ncbi:MAG: hypothetical protein R2827_08370 [Bdellovibrionales bacterium]
MPVRPFTPPPESDRTLIFPKFKPLPTENVDLELGAGTGMFAINYAANNPGRNLIAIERTASKYGKFRNQLQKTSLDNLWAVHGDATHWVPKCIKNGSVEKCFILYPNPYPKKKQANLRWQNMPFLHVLKQKMTPDGELTFASNLEWLALEAKDMLTQFWGFSLIDEKKTVSR